MAVLPIIRGQVPIRGQQMPSPGADYFGRPQAEAAGYAAERWQRVQEGADAAAIAQASTEGAAELKTALTEAKLNITDPEEYLAFSREKTKEIYDNTLSKAYANNARVGQAVRTALTNDKANAETKIQEDYFGKKKDKGVADYVLSYEQMAKNAIETTDPEERRAMFQGFGTLTGQMVRNNFLKAEDAQKFIEKFNDKVEGDRIALAAFNDPYGFEERVDKGDFAGADAIKIQRGLNIANEKIKLDESKEKAQAKADSDAAKRTYEQQADVGKLDEEALKRDERLYQWDKDIGLALRRTNLGLKEDNAFREEIIRDAMEPLNKGSPGASDIDRAEQSIRRAAGLGQISAKSNEYIAAMNRIRSLRRDNRIQGNIEGNQADRKLRQQTSENRRTIGLIYNRYFDPDEREKKQRDQATDTMNFDALGHDPAAQKQFLQNLEKRLEGNRKTEETWRPGTEGLRGFGRQ